ncbi:MAG TPA: DUF3696 domain-containing protein [Flavobacterium sp.]|uniref:DUF3696 domain-containing protein n=1 Tax=Flavobacterium sp. TaxID=239 RepID=UPI002DBD6E9A|nr:DUF3696 domain-containing protein [Flavobacterium sp.]HEU4791752.1 DUF3696 domain-containing protein [Flavobacterium sp.]
MSHLKYISFDNFRVFEQRTKFELSPLTFLTGPNSSGKSSLLKGLLLLKSNYNSDLQVLDFSGAKHNLGTFENAINKKNKKTENMTFGFQASISSEGFPFTYIKQPVTTKRSVYNILKEFKSKADTDVFLELTYKKNDRSGKLSIVELFLENDEESFLKLIIGDVNSEYHTLNFNYEKISKSKVLKELFLEQVIRNDYNITKSAKTKSYKFPTHFAFQEKTKIEYFDEPVLVFSKLYEKFLDENINIKINKDLHHYLLGHPLRRFLKDFASLIENIEYLEAVRANTRRLYTNDSQGTSFNELILEYRSREISGKSLEFTNKWLKKFEIADEIIFDNIEGVATTIYLKKNNEKIALADLGYGITQFIPILLKISLEEPIKNNKDLSIVKKLILLEEPETNLHPKLQSLIADFLLDAIRTFEVRFIVETHSEYIIRKVQILTAEYTLKPNESVIYYFNNFENDNKNEKIVKININENGTMSNDFGEGFYDEATNLKFQLLKIKTQN